MKFYWHLIISAGIISCNSSSLGDQALLDQNNTAIPAGAVQTAFDDGSRMVKVEVNDPSGNLSQTGLLGEGEKQGNWTTYYPNGMVKSMVSYFNGKMEGLSIELNTNGQLEKSMTYHNGLLEGPYKEWKYTNTKEERFYQNGKLEGTVKIYYDNGKLMEEGLYKNGIRDGVSKWYDQEGNVSIEYEYRNGELVKK